jgi:hypothetical protein
MIITEQDAADRGNSLQASRAARNSAWFEGRFWRVCTEVTGRREMNGVRFEYFQGFFQVAPPALFQTPHGSKGRSGYLIRETDAAGADIPGGTMQTFGRGALLRANELFGSVSGLPRRDPRRSGAAWVA